MSVYTFAQKVGLAVGGIICSGLLTLFHYHGGAAEQSAVIQKLFFAEIVTIPLVIFIGLFFLFMYLYRYEREVPRLRKEIAEREKAAGIAEPIVE